MTQLGTLHHCNIFLIREDNLRIIESSRFTLHQWRQRCLDAVDQHENSDRRKSANVFGGHTRFNEHGLRTPFLQHGRNRAFAIDHNRTLRQLGLTQPPCQIDQVSRTGIQIQTGYRYRVARLQLLHRQQDVLFLIEHDHRVTHDGIVCQNLDYAERAGQHFEVRRALVSKGPRIDLDLFVAAQTITNLFGTRRQFLPRFSANIVRREYATQAARHLAQKGVGVEQGMY